MASGSAIWMIWNAMVRFVTISSQSDVTFLSQDVLSQVPVVVTPVTLLTVTLTDNIQSYTIRVAGKQKYFVHSYKLLSCSLVNACIWCQIWIVTNVTVTKWHFFCVKSYHSYERYFSRKFNNFSWCIYRGSYIRPLNAMLSIAISFFLQVRTADSIILLFGTNILFFKLCCLFLNFRIRCLEHLERTWPGS